MTGDKVTERSLREYLVDKMKENGFTLDDLEKLRDILGDTQLKNVFADLNYDWTAFEEYTDELIDKTLHGEQYKIDDADDLDAFDNRYDEEGFIRSRNYRNDELPPDFDDSDFVTDVYPIGRYYKYLDSFYTLSDEQREAEQKRYEAESERGRLKRLACKTPEELYAFKRKMGWLPSLRGKTPEQREEMERIEIEKCAHEIEARNETNESYKNNIGGMSNRYYNGNSMKRSNGIRMYEMFEQGRKVGKLYEKGGTYDRNEEFTPDRLGLLAEAKRIYASVSSNLSKLIRMVDILEDRAEHIDELDIHSSSFYFEDINELKEEIKNMHEQLTGAKNNNIMYLTKKFATCAMPVFPYSRDNGKGLNVHYVNEPNWLEESMAAKRKSVKRRLYEMGSAYDRNEEFTPDRLGLIAEARRIHASIIPELDKLIRMTDIISERADYIDHENVYSSSYFFKNAEELKKEIRNLRQYIVNEKKLVTFYTQDFIICAKVVFPYNRENGIGLNTSAVNTDYYSESRRERKPRRGNMISESAYEYMNKVRGDTRVRR